MLTRGRVVEILNKLNGVSLDEWEELKKLIDNEFCVTAKNINFDSGHTVNIIKKLDNEKPIKFQTE